MPLRIWTPVEAFVPADSILEDSNLDTQGTSLAKLLLILALRAGPGMDLSFALTGSWVSGKAPTLTGSWVSKKGPTGWGRQKNLGVHDYY
jgi:hypothetical protein